jgi:micrococcal nuclease
MPKNPIIAAATFLALTIPVQAQDLSATVMQVTDGDTVQVRNQQGEIIKVRLGCIDAPELAQQPWGEQSKSRLKQLLPVGQSVSLRTIDRDKYDRMVAEVYVNNQSVNLKMVEEGMAVVYQQYLGGCSNTAKQFVQAEASAKQKSLAFWHQPDPVMPHIARKSKVAAQQGTSAQGQCHQAYPDICLPTGKDVNCSDISHKRFKVLQPDPYRLDSDRNGIGCEK